ncbi:MAG: 2,5-diamino-6-(ribosylamino)-4(3H)-pyrimidinone 5'-phosphate reductase [Thermoproteota archaeon]|nr:2,5-diamino-6-(ribosylamino)-4(3H)-pyrimidinone 5'-phosphate reductase [Thermoproteota archaeon]MDQ4023251.1 2,5-diamino-6-(ribosylamino)-4(3H)-pyrimidinone 5'-phosphate reductase [Thermoproteota archaeon]
MQVLINAAMTIDGKIATNLGDSKISSKQDLRRLHRLRSSVDAVIIGISTVIADNPKLTVRLVKRHGTTPVRIIVDSIGRIPLDSKILKSASKINTIVAVTKRASDERVDKIKSAGAIVIVAGTKTVDLKELFFILKKMGFNKILVEGGGELNWSILQLGIVNELMVTVAPRIVGGRTATTLVEGDGYDRISDGIKMELIKMSRQNNGEVVLYYKLS